MTRKTKWIVSLLTALIGVVLVFSLMYRFTIGYTENQKEQLVEEATNRLTEEAPNLKVRQGELFNGTDAYVVFTEENGNSIWFVPLDDKLEIEQREFGEVKAKDVCARSIEETGGQLVSCKYGFDERALIEVVTKADASYTYSYYTLQSGEFIRRVQLTDQM
ncbi:MAG: hypothetical protein WBV10_09970 [Exiguobacterium marinum]|uniref:DUF5590 domain-containing protein n=1 Tax=Exiguobacterium marinum TaxID=273528 RepID=A0ABY7X4U8_9BACL|nr:hypothetical protein [Exiguobacterium marinum]WDH77103.1 hypothetical protein PTI97_06180 [Exiguobacterium marinum]